MGSKVGVKKNSGWKWTVLYVKLPEKKIYAKIITARTAVFDLRGVKGQGHFFFGWK